MKEMGHTTQEEMIHKGKTTPKGIVHGSKTNFKDLCNGIRQLQLGVTHLPQEYLCVGVR